MDIPELLKILACPACRHGLVSVPGGLLCEHCQVVYPIRDQIPILLIDSAIPKAEWDNGEKKCES